MDSTCYNAKQEVASRTICLLIVITSFFLLYLRLDLQEGTYSWYYKYGQMSVCGNLLPFLKEYVINAAFKYLNVYSIRLVLFF